MRLWGQAAGCSVSHRLTATCACTAGWRRAKRALVRCSGVEGGVAKHRRLTKVPSGAGGKACSVALRARSALAGGSGLRCANRPDNRAGQARRERQAGRAPRHAAAPARRGRQLGRGARGRRTVSRGAARAAGGPHAGPQPQPRAPPVRGAGPAARPRSPRTPAGWGRTRARRGRTGARARARRARPAAHGPGRGGTPARRSRRCAAGAMRKSCFTML